MRWLGTFSGIIIAVITSGRPLVYGNQQIDVTNLGGGEAAVPVPVVIAMPLLGALVSVGTEYSGNIQLNELLQGVTRQIGD